MRSRASFKGHPLHPALIPFPFAFLTGALVFDLAARFLERPALALTASHLAIAGIATASLAAVPGIIDYVWTVPPRSSGKRRGTLHMAAMLSAVALFVVAWLLRRGAPADPSLPVLALEAVAVGLLSAGGWMGGTLVNRNQIGVDHRYARAGKWREETIAASKGKAVRVARADELEVDQMKLLHVGGRRVVLGRTRDGWAAFDDRCSHKGGSLAGGVIGGGVVHCPWHGSQFDPCTGAVLAGPARQPIAAHSVEERDGGVWLIL
jgi:nitrite reductase/ring-hydroxylating ferredoxin subunit/uncharacterized membrane protein